MRMLWKWNDIRTTLWFREKPLNFENCVDMDFGSVLHSSLVSILWNFSVQQVPLEPAKPCTCLDEVPATIEPSSCLQRSIKNLHRFTPSTVPLDPHPCAPLRKQASNRGISVLNFSTQICADKNLSRGSRIGLRLPRWRSTK